MNSHHRDPDNTKVGVLLVGLNGATASTFVCGVSAMAIGAVPPEYGVTGTPALADVMLPDAEGLAFGGWDLTSESVAAAADRHGILPQGVRDSVRHYTDRITPFRGLRTDLDLPPEKTHDNARSCQWFDEAIDAVVADIEKFRHSEKLSEVIVVYLGSPPKPGVVPLDSLDLNNLRSRGDPDMNSLVPGSLLYGVGACDARAHFVDFTPSPTLEWLPLRELAIERGVQLAGRDGSTGQTMLKVTIGELLRIRNLRLRSWYSTNVIGNHDGYVLGLAGHNEVKLRDKTGSLAPILGYDDFTHHVTIDYFPPHGDEKESWDAVDAEGWLGSHVTLRMNWRGQDSMLAAPLLFDLVRLVAFGAGHKLSGLQEQLGLFFKRPLGREGRTLSELYVELIEFYRDLV